MVKGKVKWFDPKKGFGFVVNEQGDDVFIHFTNIEKDGFKCLRDGQTVMYEEFDAGKGLQGKNVKIMAIPPPKKKPSPEKVKAQSERRNARQDARRNARRRPAKVFDNDSKWNR